MKAIVIGASVGGLKLFQRLLPDLPDTFPYPVFIVQHIPEDMPDDYLKPMQNKQSIIVKEALHNERIEAGHAYFAPAGYHMLVENEYYLALSVDKRVNYSRPSIDVLFQSAAAIYQKELLGIILTGANRDGAYGAKTIIQLGGSVWVLSPQEAQSAILPTFTKNELQLNIDDCLSFEQIKAKLKDMA